jgi:hypothetical protein
MIVKSHLRTLPPVLLISLLFVTAGAALLNAQIADPIRAHVDHSFIIGNTTLPPGEYTFRMMQDSDLAVMTATSENDKTSVDFIVRETTADHTPSHSEFGFRKYGNTEFLSKLFEGNQKAAQKLRKLADKRRVLLRKCNTRQNTPKSTSRGGSSKQTQERSQTQDDVHDSSRPRTATSHAEASQKENKRA